MTRVKAQTIASRNGRMIQKQATISPAMNSTDSVVRVRSWCGWDMLLGPFAFWVWLSPRQVGGVLLPRVFSRLGFRCHCERSEAIPIQLRTTMEIAASLCSSQ